MITKKIQALFDFIDFLHSNIKLCLSQSDLFSELNELDRKRNELRPIDNYKKKLFYEEIQMELHNKLSILEESIIKPTISKAYELQICDYNYITSLWNWNIDEIFNICNTFDKKDIPLVKEYKQKYIDFRNTPNNDCYQSLFFSYLDETLKELFDFFKDSSNNEFETFEVKTINANSFGDAVKLAIENKNARILINNSYQNQDKALPRQQTETKTANDNTLLQSNSTLQDLNSFTKLKAMSEVFISYSWDSNKHKDNVLAFADHLRQNGYDTEIDRTLSQQQTATDFTKMMHEAMQNHKKVVVVLSKGYKTKADSFIGGAGKEYQLLLNDIDDNPKKYIFVCLEPRSKDLIPFGLMGREVVDLTTPEGMTILDYKLQDVDQVLLSPVAASKPILTPQKANSFTIPAQIDCPIEIVKMNVKQTGSAAAGGIYTSIEYLISFDYKNISSDTVNSFDYEVRFNRYLDANVLNTHQNGNDTLIQDNITKPTYKGQTKTTQDFPIKVASYNVNQVINTDIRIKIYTDAGETEKSFKVADSIKVDPDRLGAYPDKTDLHTAFNIS